MTDAGVGLLDHHCRRSWSILRFGIFRRCPTAFDALIHGVKGCELLGVCIGWAACIVANSRVRFFNRWISR